MIPSCQISLDPTTCHKILGPKEGAACVPRRAAQLSKIVVVLLHRALEDLRWSWAADPKDLFSWSTSSSYCSINTSQKTSNDRLLDIT
uniref:Uncharacterized protein n=1 Tax=Triticum urartu TaxID=4572 RepID=A0A8R7TYB3_TRIUA